MSTNVVVNISELLIVPYGIETIAHSRYILIRKSLLIVPYGIETQYYHR